MPLRVFRRRPSFTCCTRHATRHQLGGDGAESLRFGENAIYRLAADPVVVRIARSADRLARVERELCVARWLAAAHIPAVRVIEEIEQPLLVDGHPVSFWRSGSGGYPAPTHVDLARLIAAFHSLPDSPCDLPSFQPPQTSKARLAKTIEIESDDREFLRERCARHRGPRSRKPSTSRSGQSICGTVPLRSDMADHVVGAVNPENHGSLAFPGATSFRLITPVADWAFLGQHPEGSVKWRHPPRASAYRRPSAGCAAGHAPHPASTPVAPQVAGRGCGRAGPARGRPLAAAGPPAPARKLLIPGRSIGLIFLIIHPPSGQGPPGSPCRG